MPGIQNKTDSGDMCARVRQRQNIFRRISMAKRKADNSYVAVSERVQKHLTRRLSPIHWVGDVYLCLLPVCIYAFPLYAKYLKTIRFLLYAHVVALLPLMSAFKRRATIFYVSPFPSS